MATSMRVVVPVVFLLLGSIVSTVTPAAVSCDTVSDNLLPCYTYAAQVGTSLGTCCDGIKQLNEVANSTSDRQGVCRCLKSFFGERQVPPHYSQDVLMYFKAIAALPGKCGFTYNIDPTADCNSIQ